MIVLKLKSGNLFFFKRKAGWVDMAMVISPEDVFLGGFAGREAKRKLAAFKKIAVEEFELLNKDFPCISRFNLIPFSEKLGAVSELFLKNASQVFNDIDDCDGTSSHAQSCSDRRNYYKSSGLIQLYDSSIKCPIWAFVANHLSIWGTENFRYTFFKVDGVFQTDVRLSVEDSYIVKTKYSKEGFKAPAYYFKALCKCR